MRTFLIAAAAALSLSPCAAADFPSRPVRLVVTIPPGGAPDVLGRVLADALAPALGRPVVVENRPGSNGNVAAEHVARSAADGHTLLVGQDTLFTVNPHLYADMPVDVRSALVPVAPLAWSTFYLLVSPKLPAATLEAFIEHAREARPPLAYASGGYGSQHHLLMEQLKQSAGIDLMHVPYRGGAHATLAVIAGDAAALFSGTSAAPHVKAGRLRALAVAGRRRARDFPLLPALGERYPQLDTAVWLGLFAPAGVPAEALERLRRAVADALASAEVRERLAAAGGLEPLELAPGEFAALIERDRAKYGALLKRIGARIE